MKNITLISLLFLSGCLGYMAHVPDSKKDFKGMSKDTSWIRARELTDDDISSLSYFTGPVHLDFMGGYSQLKITDAALKKVSELDSPGVNVLSVGYNNIITDEGLSYLKYARISMLNLRASQAITDQGIKNLSDLPDLRWLDISGIKGVTDKGLEHLLQCQSIKTLRLGRANQDPNHYISRIESENDIDLSRENQITINGLRVLLKLPRLQNIYIVSSRSELISTEARAEILEIFKDYNMRVEDYDELWEKMGGALD
jgi:hypothetical protein